MRNHHGCGGKHTTDRNAKDVLHIFSEDDNMDFNITEQAEEILSEARSIGGKHKSMHALMSGERDWEDENSLRSSPRASSKPLQLPSSCDNLQLEMDLLPLS